MDRFSLLVSIYKKKISQKRANKDFIQKWQLDRLEN